jgi:hypothetical protein
MTWIRAKALPERVAELADGWMRNALGGAEDIATPIFSIARQLDDT